jgi:sortase (surface protein transpeptidase)
MRIRRTGGRQGIWSLAATAVVAVAGASFIVMALASQEQAPAPSAPASREASVHPGVERQETTLTRSVPVSLDIPVIDVHAAMQSVGLDEDNTIEVPAPGPHYNDPAWYRYSPTPGELGPAIIVGHVDSAAEGPSVFFDLGALRRDDKIAVTREDGQVAKFEVDEVRTFSKEEFPTKRVYGRTDHAALRLITCGGPFDEVAGHYVANIVVFASLV